MRPIGFEHRVDILGMDVVPLPAITDFREIRLLVTEKGQCPVAEAVAIVIQIVHPAAAAQVFQYPCVQRLVCFDISLFGQ